VVGGKVPSRWRRSTSVCGRITSLCERNNPVSNRDAMLNREKIGVPIRQREKYRVTEESERQVQRKTEQDIERESVQAAGR